MDDAVAELLRRVEANLDASLGISDTSSFSQHSFQSAASSPRSAAARPAQRPAGHPAQPPDGFGQEYEEAVVRFQQLGESWLRRHRVVSSDLPERVAVAPPPWAKPYYKASVSSAIQEAQPQA